MRPRRVQITEIDPATVGFEEAYEMERTNAWPSWRDRRDFWRRADVPAKWRDSAEPDPRVTLGDPRRYMAYIAEVGRWESGRHQWLATAAGEVANG